MLFRSRYGNLNAKQNVKLVMMDAGGRDILSLERVENGKFVKADIFEHPVSFSVESHANVGSPEEALSASLNKYGTVNLDYMREITDSTAFSDYVAYGFAGPEMDPYTEGYHFIGKNVIFFSKKRYEFVSSGCYWLSETPLAAGSCSWNTMRARHCNWVRLRDRKSGAEFRVLDIHLDHKSDDARREQMKMIVGECAQYADGFPQIICGDFNSGIENAPVACLRDAGWQEAYEAVHGPGEAGFTYHGFKGPDYRKKNARRIDFIFVRGNLQPVAAEILRDKVDGLYPSDHYFLMSDFIIQ